MGPWVAGLPIGAKLLVFAHVQVLGAEAGPPGQRALPDKAERGPVPGEEQGKFLFLSGRSDRVVCQRARPLGRGVVGAADSATPASIPHLPSHTRS